MAGTTVLARKNRSRVDLPCLRRNQVAEAIQRAPAQVRRYCWLKAQFIISTPPSSLGARFGLSVGSTMEVCFFALFLGCSRKSEPHLLTLW